jgi:hypothetical protein
LIQGAGLSLLCGLTRSPHLPLAQNALWALKNLSFHALDSLKAQITSTLTWQSLREFLSIDTPSVLRVQALELAQNLLADCGTTEITRIFEGLGEGSLLTVLGRSLGGGVDDEIRIPVSYDGSESLWQALYILSNLALGNEKLRATMVSRVDLLEGLCMALVGLM